MRKFKNVFALFIFLTLALCSCDFISYIETTDPIEEGIQEIRNEYIMKLDCQSNESNYYESERILFVQYLVEGKAQIIECSSKEEIKSIYETYAQLIDTLYTISEYEEELLNQKKEYFNSLSSISSMDLYRNEEKEIYLFYMDAAEDAINLAEDLATIEKIFALYSEIILEIKTDEMYDNEEKIAFEEYKKNSIGLVNKYLDISLYREKEQTQIMLILESTIDEIKKQINQIEIDNLVRDYKIKVYMYKTDLELYNEELTELKNYGTSEINNYIDLSKYRNNEKEIINTILAKFHIQIDLCIDKESVYEVVSIYKDILDSIKTDSELYEDERIELINNAFDEMLVLVDLDSMTEDSKLEYLEYCNQVKTDMLLLETKEEINSRLILEKQNIYLIGAQLGDKLSLDKYQDLLAENLRNYLNVSLYREEQKIEVLDLLNTYGDNIKKQVDYNSTLLMEKEAHAKLDNVMTNNEMWEKEDIEFEEKLKSLYGNNILKSPMSLVKAYDYYQLASIIDYYAFYQLDSTSFVRNKFRVNVFFETDKAPDYIKNEVYWYCELLNGAVGIEAKKDINEDYIVFTLIPYDIASVSNKIETTYLNKLNMVNQFNFSSDYVKREKDFNDFSYMNYGNGNISGVWNSQQLWYALEHEYIPNCVINSSASYLLEYAKSILRDIIYMGMTTEEKIYTIFNWIGNNIQYDDKAYKYNNSSDMNLYPDENYSRLTSTHIEGGLLDGISICAGFAKTYLLLLRIEGIESIRIIARNNALRGINTINSRDYGGGGFGFHEFVYIKIDNEWYYSDAERSCLENNNRFRSNIYLLLSPNSQNYGFTVMHPQLTLAESIENNIYSKIHAFSFSCFETTNYKDLLNEFSVNSSENDLLSIIVSNSSLEQLINEVINLSNLNYLRHSINSSGQSFTEVLCYIDY